ncbi:MAG: hypothetical protein JJU29_23590 [Verrucomicrobia bacterium]|nr:hypothetical protein [Verrucomicrobiota bacterium]MCH8510346.1 hypothetical protein [Kiritimatiellia bacterium]
MRECIQLMRRYQVDAVGHPSDINGMVVFHPWKFKVVEVLQGPDMAFELEKSKFKDFAAYRAWFWKHGDPEVKAHAATLHKDQAA